MHIPDLIWQLALAEERRRSSAPSSDAHSAALRDLEELARRIDEASDHTLTIVLDGHASPASSQLDAGAAAA